MAYSQIFSTTFALFATMAAGFFARRAGFLREDTVNDVSRFVIKILFPIYLFRAAVTYMGAEYISRAPIFILLHIVVALVMLAFSGWLVRLAKIDPERASVLRFCSLVGNTGFFGLTFATAFFGPEGIIAAILYDFGGSLILFFVFVPILLDKVKRKSGLLPILKEPNIIAVISGMTLGILGIHLPEFLRPTFDTLSQLTLPLALIICGAQLAAIKFAPEQNFSQVAYVILLKMVLMPVVMLFLLYFIDLPKLIKQFLLVEAAMPSGISMVNFAKTYGHDSDFAAVSVFVTTTCSLFWIPAMLILGSLLF